MAKKLDFVIPAVGGVTGANLSACLGNIGLVGGFGGISVGLVGMTGIGILTSSAIYASLQGLETNDRNVGLALGIGSLGGIGIYSTFGGVGVAVKGTAFGVGVGSMAIAGGLVGLGIYGLMKMLSPTYSNDNFYRNLEFFDRITREYEEALFWQEVTGKYENLEAELQRLLEEVSVQENQQLYSTEITIPERLSWQCFQTLKGHQENKYLGKINYTYLTPLLPLASCLLPIFTRKLILHDYLLGRSMLVLMVKLSLVREKIKP
ncbi:membrane hypothetical protein [Microcystis aeruginosa PCC 9807]|uniref:Uncharacterized protein n=1 Tax=Microcystis aeruginosa PCC 9807 TaxID=1160283 RepID=I4GYI3_MICAE|nr:hypothetical protein [Microcystis aeruginosa]CCI14857.1 membrane hypothetical protein [Microcystis aeruginosa PCC 9807]